jgi:hypothetical protein
MGDDHHRPANRRRWGGSTPGDSDSGPGRPSARRTSPGMLENGRYLIRQASSATRTAGDSPTAVRCVAHDMVGGIEVHLDVSLSGGPIQRYRIDDSAVAARRDLPNLYAFATTLPLAIRSGAVRSPLSCPGFCARCGAR